MDVVIFLAIFHFNENDLKTDIKLTCSGSLSSLLMTKSRLSELKTDTFD